MKSLEGCCGVLELYGLSAFDYSKSVSFDGPEDDGDIPELEVTLSPVLSFLYEIYEDPDELAIDDDAEFTSGKMLIATTIPSQKSAISFLASLGMIARESFRNPTHGHTVTLWSMIIPKNLEAQFKKEFAAAKQAVINNLKPAKTPRQPHW